MMEKEKKQAISMVSYRQKNNGFDIIGFLTNEIFVKNLLFVAV